MEIIKDGKALDTLITSIKGRAAKLDKDIQHAALSAIWHFGVRTNDKGELIGDVGFINRLYLSLGKGARHVALTEWLLHFGGVEANTGQNKDTTPFIKCKGKAVDLEGGTKTPWYDMKPSKAPDQVVDMLKVVLAAIKKGQGGDKQIEHGEILAELQAIAEKYAPADAVDLSEVPEAPM
jgi:hypothetical protein